MPQNQRSPGRPRRRKGSAWRIPWDNSRYRWCSSMGGGANAGRPRGAKSNVPHRARPDTRLVTRCVSRFASLAVYNLRRQSLFLAVRRALSAASSRAFRLVHFSVQRDHIHLIVEARDRSMLLLSSRGLSIRVARAVNHHLDRRGKVFGGRYHARALTTPREVRSALVYVLQNWRKHIVYGASHPARPAVDPCSSSFWFTGWKHSALGSPPAWSERDPLPVRSASTWLGAMGWRKLGLIGATERPADKNQSHAWIIATRPP